MDYNGRYLFLLAVSFVFDNVFREMSQWEKDEKVIVTLPPPQKKKNDQLKTEPPTTNYPHV